MAGFCQDMISAQGSESRFGLFLLAPGILLFLIGVAIFAEPRMLVWAIGGCSILLGMLMIGTGLYLRRHRTDAGLTP